MATNSPANRKDPLPVFCFKIELNFPGGGGGDAFFKSVSGIKYETEAVPLKEGGVNDTTFQLVGATKWANLVFKQGFTGNSHLLTWREDWITGRAMHRIDGKIHQLNTAMEKMATWSFVKGWPIKWEMAEFDASKSEVAIETLEIAHNGIKFG